MLKGCIKLLKGVFCSEVLQQWTFLPIVMLKEIVRTFLSIVHVNITMTVNRRYGELAIYVVKT